jgi:acyl carrier protein
MSIASRVNKIVAEVFLMPQSSVTEGNLLVEELGASEEDIKKIMIEIEKEFFVDIPHSYYRHVMMVSDLVMMVETLLVCQNPL